MNQKIEKISLKMDNYKNRVCVFSIESLYGILLIYCQVILSRPVLPVQIAVTDGFSQMGGLYQFCTFEVGNGACHF